MDTIEELPEDYHDKYPHISIKIGQLAANVWTRAYSTADNNLIKTIINDLLQTDVTNEQRHDLNMKINQL